MWHEQWYSSLMQARVCIIFKFNTTFDIIREEIILINYKFKGLDNVFLALIEPKLEKIQYWHDSSSKVENFLRVTLENMDKCWRSFFYIGRED